MIEKYIYMCVDMCMYFHVRGRVKSLQMKENSTDVYPLYTIKMFQMSKKKKKEENDK